MKHLLKEDTYHADRTRKATDRLLALLIEHHPEHAPPGLKAPEPKPVVIPVNAASEKAEPVEICVLPIPNPPNSVDGIKRVVCRHFGISHNDIIGPRRDLRVVRPRQIAMFLCREFTTRSLPEISRRFGGRDHTTGLSAVKRVHQLVARDPTLAAHVNDLRKQLAPEASA